MENICENCKNLVHTLIEPDLVEGELCLVWRLSPEEITDKFKKYDDIHHTITRCSHFEKLDKN